VINQNQLSWYRGQIQPGARSPLQLVLVQSTSFCNIDCAYCYLPLRNNKARFDLERLPALIAKLNDAGLIDRELTFVWHAGEPLVLPPDWYRRAFAIAAANVPEGVTVRHCFQTNAILLSDDYARFFKETGASVGVSIDGPRPMHDARRMTRDGKGTFERTMAGITRLREQGVPFTTISVIGAEALDQPDLVYDFFKALGTFQAGFNVEEIEGENRTSTLAGAEMEARVRAFYRRLAERARNDPQPLSIREFNHGRDAALGALAGASAGGGSTECNPLAIISVDTEGRISTFSPELLQVSGETDAYTFGTIETIDFTKLWQNNHFAAIHADIERGVAICRETCGYFGACHGGAPANKLAENGTFASGETMYCRLAKQAVVDVMEEVLLSELQHKQARRASDKPAPAAPATRPTRIVGAGDKPSGVAVIKSETLKSMFSGRLADAAPSAKADFNVAPASERPALNPLFPHLGTINIFAPAGRIAVTHGTREPREDESNYKDKARLPHADWWRLKDNELAQLRSSTRSPGSLNFAALIDLPAELRQRALELGRQLAGEGKDAGPREGGELEKALAGELGALLAPDSEARLLGSLVQAGGLLTSTLDPTDNKRQGLHVDSWARVGLFERGTAPNRVCVNLGTEPRRLLLLDLGVDQIAGQMGGPAAMNPTDIARAFLALHPTYPVLSIEVGPGEAYVASTENLVHDGSTLGNSAADVTLTLLGQFRRERIADFLLQPEAIAAR